MREIGSRANLEQEVIKYIIDGIHDESSNKKNILYGAKDFSEFNKRIILNEQVSKSNQCYDTSQTIHSRRDWRQEMKKGNIETMIRISG